IAPAAALCKRPPRPREKQVGQRNRQVEAWPGCRRCWGRFPHTSPNYVEAHGCIVTEVRRAVRPKPCPSVTEGPAADPGGPPLPFPDRPTCPDAPNGLVPFSARHAGTQPRKRHLSSV